MTFELACVVAWCTLPSFHGEFSPAIIILDVFFTCTTGFVIDIASKRRHSWVSALLFLFLGSISSFTRSQGYYQTHGFYFATSNMVAVGCCRLALFFLLLSPQNLILKNAPKRVSPYISWDKELLSLSNSAVLGMFRVFPDKESVQTLEPELDPQNLAEVFSKLWATASENPNNILLTVCLKTVSWFLFLGVLPRLVTSALLLAQPLLLKRVILFVGVAASDIETHWTLVLSTAVIFGVSTVSRAYYHLLSHRMHVALRGALLFHIFQKTYRLGPKQAKSSAAMSLITDDIPIICENIQLYYHMFNDAIHIGLGLLLLWRLAGAASLLSIATLVLSVMVRVLIQSRVSKAVSDATDASKKRSEIFQSAISQLPLIKMLGLGPVIVEELDSARQTEMKRIGRSADMRCLTMVPDIVVDIVTPSTLCLGFYLMVKDRIMPESLFPSLALTVHLNIALYTGMRQYASREQRFFRAVQRVESFFALKEFIDLRKVTDMGRIAVKCVKLAISPEGCEEPILQNINFSIDKATVTTCIGPSSSGKSTFLQSLTGESKIVEGTMHVGNAQVAYCDQEPWLENGSIRENVLAGLEFDPERYDLVLRLCLLHEDIRKLDEGDAYITGPNGANLSGGQRHRVVRIKLLLTLV